jgi:glycosyltransferase involved in cell wall biosynthesis
VDLSILIPARNEMFLARTIQDILDNMRGDTEIIAVLDGAWAEPPIPDHERVNIVYHPVSIGQRAATNQAARLSSARYVMKCDAHCAFDEGFDVKLMADMQDDWTVVPRMYNLHAFDWVCQCGHRKYQGPTPEKCSKCGGPMEREMVWKAKPNPDTTAMRFDRELHFQYWRGYKRR